MNAGRTLLGKWSSTLTRVRIYQTSDALDVETNEHFEVTKTRVFFEDVLLVTYHREYGALYLTLTGLFSLGFLMLAGFLASLSKDSWVVGVVFAIFGSPFILAFLVRLAFGVDVVTIFGRRSKASLRYRFRKARAREVYGKICSLVRQAQREPLTREESPAPPLPDSVPPLPPAQ